MSSNYKSKLSRREKRMVKKVARKYSKKKSGFVGKAIKYGLIGLAIYSCAKYAYSSPMEVENNLYPMSKLEKTIENDIHNSREIRDLDCQTFYGFGLQECGSQYDL